MNSIFKIIKYKKRVHTHKNFIAVGLPLRTLICRIVMLTHIRSSECWWWDIAKYTKPQSPIMTSILPIMTSIYHIFLCLMFLENASYISLMDKREYIISQAKSWVSKLPLLAYAKISSISALSPIQLILYIFSREGLS